MKLFQYQYFRWLIYLLYALMVTAVLLIIRFPNEKVKTFLVETVENKLPESQCSIDNVSYKFPLTIKVKYL